MYVEALLQPFGGLFGRITITSGVILDLPFWDIIKEIINSC